MSKWGQDEVREQLAGTLIHLPVKFEIILEPNIDYIQKLYVAYYDELDELMNAKIHRTKSDLIKQYMNSAYNIQELYQQAISPEYIEQDIPYMRSWRDFLLNLNFDINEHLKENPHLML